MTTCVGVCRSGDLRAMNLDQLADVRGVGRDELEARIAFLVEEQKTLEATLRGAQEKGTRLHDALVEAKKAWPHWICSQCRTFNGESKQPRLACRACGSLREGQTGR